jgi:uncharacterized protein YkwD
MKRFWMSLTGACTVLVVLGVGRAGEAPAFKMSDDEAKILELTNAERKKKELTPLRPNAVLFKVAREHSANMAKQKKMDHILDGKTPFDRMKDAKYGYQRAGENIAAGDENDLAKVMRAWMESKLHRENILGPEFTEIGIGMVLGKDGQTYYTQVFAKPAKK